ncbi:hypothetical protein Ddye_031711 [Dipteronia dyeriana]|uniref:Uncharacterized protein n=1 Tax=Dipteronia dyeriana TaxID=168575 RepID=A0AAD9TJV9_9ROSI|nr:hypothetical protein Ddye_031711 [Dipteronia dyeriana]
MPFVEDPTLYCRQSKQRTPDGRTEGRKEQSSGEHWRHISQRTLTFRTCQHFYPDLAGHVFDSDEKEEEKEPRSEMMLVIMSLLISLQLSTRSESNHQPVKQENMASGIMAGGSLLSAYLRGLLDKLTSGEFVEFFEDTK